MAPFTIARQETAGNTTSPDASPSPSSSSSSVSPALSTTTIILIVVIAVTSLAIVSFALYFCWDRRQRIQYREACRKDPYLTRKEFARKRKMSALQRLEEEELQRDIMIRKSLAGRSSRSSSRRDDEPDMPEMRQTGTTNSPSTSPPPPHLQREWEVNSRRARSDSAQSSSSGAFDTSGSEWTEVELPGSRQARSSSPDRSPLLSPPPPTSSSGSVQSQDQYAEDWPLRLTQPSEIQPAYLERPGGAVVR